MNRIFAMDRPHRPWALEQYLKHNPDLGETERDQLIEAVWCDYEFPAQDRARWQRLLRLHTAHSTRTEPVRIYRGSDEIGPSWTVSLEQARWFAHRNVAFTRYRYEFAGIHPDYRENIHRNVKCSIWQAVVKPQGIIFETNSRQEQEVVVMSWHKSIWLQKPTVLETTRECLEEVRDPRKSVKQAG